MSAAISSQRLYEQQLQKRKIYQIKIKKFFQSNSTIDNFINQFFKPKRHDYNQNILQFYSNTHKFIEKKHLIPNQEGQLLYASLFYKEAKSKQKRKQQCQQQQSQKSSKNQINQQKISSQKDGHFSSHKKQTKIDSQQNICKIIYQEDIIQFKNSFQKTKQQLLNIQACIIYCHGFGSTRLQSSHILKVLPKQIALCCFDFSGSGKSQGDIVTFGAKQLQDIHSVKNYLQKQLGFKKFILWGRSMGATSCLLYSLKYEKSKQVSKKLSKDKTSGLVIYQIIDSPFISFEKIAVQMGKKFVSMPQFGTNIVLDMMRKNCAILQSYNPFEVNLESQSNLSLLRSLTIPTLVIYSQKDEIVSHQNSLALCKNFSMCSYEKMIITQKHNTPRPTQTLAQIMKKIQIHIKKFQINRKKGFLFRSFMSRNSSRNFFLPSQNKSMNSSGSSLKNNKKCNQVSKRESKIYENSYFQQQEPILKIKSNGFRSFSNINKNISNDDKRRRLKINKGIQIQKSSINKNQSLLTKNKSCLQLNFTTKNQENNLVNVENGNQNNLNQNIKRNKMKKPEKNDSIEKIQLFKRQTNNYNPIQKTVDDFNMNLNHKNGNIGDNQKQKNQYGLQLHLNSKQQTPNVHNINNNNAKITTNIHEISQRQKKSHSTLPHDYDFRNYQSPFRNNLKSNNQIKKSQNSSTIQQNTYQLKKVHPSFLAQQNKTNKNIYNSNKNVLQDKRKSLNRNQHTQKRPSSSSSKKKLSVSLLFNNNKQQSHLQSRQNLHKNALINKQKQFPLKSMVIRPVSLNNKQLIRQLYKPIQHSLGKMKSEIKIYPQGDINLNSNSIQDRNGRPDTSKQSSFNHNLILNKQKPLLQFNNKTPAHTTRTKNTSLSQSADNLYFLSNQKVINPNQPIYFPHPINYTTINRATCSSNNGYRQTYRNSYGQ